MMDRLFHVTAGYLKFTFACMLVGTATFFLAGLAITAPKIFVIAMAIAVGAFFVVRMEVRDNRRARERGKKPEDPNEQERIQQSLVQWLTLAEASTMLVYTVSSSIRTRATSLWISEWDHVYDPRAIPPTASLDQATLESAEMSLASNALRLLERELDAHGLHTVSVSRRPAKELATAMQEVSPGSWARISISQHDASKAKHPISIIFLHEAKRMVRTESVEKILQGSFRMIRSDPDIQHDSKPSSPSPG
jgi:hypothetical protein